MRRTRTLMLTVIVAVVLAACGSAASDSTAASDDSAATTPPPAATTDEEVAADADATDEAHDDAAESDDHAEEGFAFGEPADPAEADRTVEVEATEMAFTPAMVDVSAGEVVTFEVTNVGQIPHDFTLGDEHAQNEHAKEMEEMGDDAMAHADPNTMTLAPGESGSITWRFADGGEVLYGCHQPGHYDAGMVGSIEFAE